jgi:serpin B
MVASGAAGRTATEMAHVLHLPNTAAAAQALPYTLGAATHDTANTLRVANTVWAQQGMPVAALFANILRTRFGSTIRIADFDRDPDSATNQINATVAGQTNGMIPHLFPAGALDASTRMVLTNAVYLAASWAQAFDPKLTSPGPFTRPDGSVVQVPMMHQDPSDDTHATPFGYAAGTGYQVVTLPYTGGKLAATVLLPSGTSLTSLLDLLRTNGLPSMLRSVHPAPVDIVLPKFTLTSNLDLTATLASLGMPSAFSDTADFSGITTATQLNIQTVQHDVVVRVDEHGTTAAASTGVGMQATSAVERTVVTVNRPFLLVITDTATGATLFLGRVTNPT